MNDDTEDGPEPTEKKSLPSIANLYEKQLPEMKAAETKQEAYEAIEPLVVMAGEKHTREEYRDLPPGAGILPQKVARVTPLTEQDVEDKIVEATWWWVELSAEGEGAD